MDGLNSLINGYNENGFDGSGRRGICWIALARGQNQELGNKAEEELDCNQI
jgi:hypothetical protein